MEELTNEEQDQLILDELNITDDSETKADENSIINEDEEEFEEEEDIESESDEDEEEDIEPKKSNNFAKLLAKKNEAKREAEAANKEKDEALSQVQELQAKLDKMDEEWDFGNEEYVNTLVEKKIAERDELTDYFDEFSELKEYKKDILKYKRETGLSLEQATKLYLAENNPSLLLSPQVKAKAKSWIFKTPWRASQKLQTWKKDYSNVEFADMISKGLIQL